MNLQCTIFSIFERDKRNFYNKTCDLCPHSKRMGHSYILAYDRTEPFCTKQNTSTEKGTIPATRPSVLCHVYRKLTPISLSLMSGPYRCHNDLILLQVCQRNIALFNLYASWILPFRRRRIHLLLKRVFYRAMVPVQLCGKHCGPFCGVWSGSVFFFFFFWSKSRHSFTSDKQQSTKWLFATRPALLDTSTGNKIDFFIF